MLPGVRKPLALGKPQVKPYFNWVDLLAVFVSFASLTASICVVSPRLSLSWSLGYEDQLVVIGFLLSVMNICLYRVVPTMFLILEYRWGTSCLQNYDAILRNSLTLSQTSEVWRAILLMMIALPLGLSAAYKRFPGGQTTIPITSQHQGYYGLAAPATGENEILKSSVYLMINASVPFITASSNDNHNPKPALPAAYGYNTLLLSNTSAALLDIPTPGYVAWIQQILTDSESWTLTAQVNATVARLDSSFQHETVDDTFWMETFDSGDNHHGLSSFEIFQYNLDLGLLLGVNCGTPYCVLGFFNGSTEGVANHGYGEPPTTVFMRSSPWKFDIRRERCAGTWTITQNQLHLTSGSCDKSPTYQDLWCIADAHPFYLDAMPVLAHSIDGYTPSGPRNSSQWRMPAIVVSVATMYWARLVYMNPQLSEYTGNNAETYYPATNETITSTNGTLDAQWLLYLVLCVQPAITLMVFVAAIFCYRTPISKGFGLIALFAGMERGSLDILKGAALSGELREPVNVEFTVQNYVEKDPKTARLGYKLQPLTHDQVQEQAVLKRRTIYR